MVHLFFWKIKNKVSIFAKTSDMSENKYLNSFSFKEGQYGLKMSINVQKAIEELKALENEKGYANFEIKKRQTPSQYGHTHYAQVDTWQPK